MRVSKWLLRAFLAAVVGWLGVWLACDLPAVFGIHFTFCGDNAYIWLVPAFFLAFSLLGAIPYFRFGRDGSSDSASRR